MPNAMLPEAGSAHVEELSDPYLLWFWNSNVRSTAIVLELAGQGGRRRTRRCAQMVRWLMAARKNGRWGNTQENALRDGGARRLLPQVRSRRPGLHAPWSGSATRSSRARSSRAARPTSTREGRADGASCSPTAPPASTAADLHARRHRHALLHRAAALRRRRAVPGRARQRLPHRAHATRRSSRTATRPAADELSRPAISCA